LKENQPPLITMDLLTAADALKAVAHSALIVVDRYENGDEEGLEEALKDLASEFRYIGRHS